MFPNGSTKLRARERDATERSRHARLARLIASPAERQYQFESGDALPPSATVTLPLGFELRFDAANARFFFVDHAKRATTWQDPRNDPPDVAISNEATEAALRQLELVSSGMLPEQAARPADFRVALGHALRAALHADDVGEAAAALGPTHVRRVQHQQHIHLALIERLRDPPRPTATLQEAWAANAKRHAWAPAAPLDAHYYDSLRKHVDAHDLLEMYTSGFFGPKMSRLYRVRDRLDSLGVAMLRASELLEFRALVTEQVPDKLGKTVDALQPLLAERKDVLVVGKTKFSMCTEGSAAFLEAKSENLASSQALLVGLEAHVCVAQTAFDLLDRGWEVFVLVDGVSSIRVGDRAAALRRMERAGCVLTTSEAALFEMIGDATHAKFRDISKLVREPRPETPLPSV